MQYIKNETQWIIRFPNNEVKGKGKVYIRTKWRNKAELIFVFCSIKPLGVILLSPTPGRDASP